MKNFVRFIAFALCILTLFAFVACDTKNENKTTTTTTTTTTGGGGSSTDDPSDDEGPIDFYGADTSVYVTLGQYKDLTVEVDQVTVSEEDIENVIKAALEESSTYEKIYEGTVEENVKFSIDFEGYCNGIQFQGGTAADQIVYIKDGEFCTADGGPFVDGFVEPTLGASVGDRVEVPVTFSADYHNAELAGKDATFYVTINYLVGDPILPELTDEWVKQFTQNQISTVADFRAGVKAELESQLKNVLLTNVFELIMENATYITLPEKQVNYYYNYYKEYILYYGQMYGMTYEEMLSGGFVEYMFGIRAKTDAELIAVAEKIVKEELANFAFIKAEGIEVSDEEYEDFIDELVKSGYTREELEKNYTKSYLCGKIALTKAYDRVIEINNFVEKK